MENNEILSAADLLNLLFDTIRRPDGKRYTQRQVAEAIGIYDTTITAIRAGKVTNPGIYTIKKLCDFFEVPLNYFAAESIEECYGILARRQADSDVPPAMNEIMFRSMGLSEKSQRDVLQVLEWVQAAERERKAKPEGNEAAQSA